MKFNDFQEILWQQEASGKDGFEGLVAKLLEKLTGQRFYLSLSGRQEGKDMSGSGQHGNLLAVECKRYEDSTSLKSDELLAKFSAASLSLSPTDLWMVVTTKRLGEQHHNQLKLANEKSGIAYFSIDAEGNENSSLCALCANAPDIVVEHLKSCRPPEKATNRKKKSYKPFDTAKLSEIQKYLENLNQCPEVQKQIKHLKEELLAENIGYANWRKTQNTWLSEQFCDKDKATATFGQNLAVSSQNQSLIPRQSAFETLDKWWQDSNRKPLIILGEEGDGKTWAIAAWLAQQLKQSDFPPVVFISATQVSTEEPLILITETLKRQLSEPRSQYWEKRLQHWLNRSAGLPVFLLVLDGLNERPSFQWGSLFSKLALYTNQVAVLATCRNIFWQESLSDVLNEVSTWILEPYDNNELAFALKQKDLRLNEFDQQLHHLLRKPRYFDLTVKLRSQLSTEGEITIERLIYEDQRDKYSRKHGNSQLLTHEKFQEFISTLAEQAKKSKFLTRKQISEELSGYGEEHSNRLEELITSGILIKKGNKLEINHNSLVLGLGLSLAFDVEKVTNQSETEAMEVIAHHLEPQSDMDIKVSICGMALYHSLVEKNFPEIGRLCLFHFWIKGRNISKEDWQHVPAYFPLRPETYLTMAERLWSWQTDNHQAQDAFMSGFLKYGKIEKVKNVLIPAFQRWMGFIHPDGHTGRHARGHDENRLTESQQAVRTALGQNIVSGAVSLYGYPLNVIEDEGLLRLSKVVLAIISHEDRIPYCQSMVTGMIAGTVMGYPDFQEQLAWILRTAPDSIENPLLEAIRELLKHSEATAQKSAWWLLSALGTEQAFALREQIPKEFHFKNAMWQLYEENPCEFSLSTWTTDNYLKCLKMRQFHPDVIARQLKEVALDPNCPVPDGLPEQFMRVGENINLNQVRNGSMRQTSEDLEFEQLEPALCAYQPKRYAELLRSLARQLPDRIARSRFHLGFLIYEHLLIMGQEERQAIDNAWRKSITAEKENKSEAHSEEILFPCVLKDRNLLEQLQFIEERNGRSSYFSENPPFLQKIEPESLPDLAETLERLRAKGQHYNLLYQLPEILLCFDDSIRQLILDIFQSDDKSYIRSYCLKLITTTKDTKAVQAILASDWKAESTDKDRQLENYWGSKLLCEFGQNLPFSEIIRRVSPELLGYAVQQRGNIQEEVLAYAEILQRIWSGIVAKKLKIPVESELTKVKLDILNPLNEFPTWSLNDETEGLFKFISADSVWGGSAGLSNLPPNPSDVISANQQEIERIRQRVLLLVDEQCKLGNIWFMNSFRQESFSEVVKRCPQSVKQWLEAVLTGNQSSCSVIARCRSFYEALCYILLQEQPEQGCNLFKRLRENNSFRIVDSNTGISLYLFSLFKVNSSIPVDNLQKELIEKSTTDLELFEFTFLAQLEKKHNWLMDVIDHYLNSRKPYEVGLGIRLLGFLDTQKEGETRLSSWVEDKPDSWLHHIAERSQHDYQRNQWARHWFKQFLNHDDDLHAWAAFRLFLQCVDRRFWLWAPEVLKKESVKPQRLEHYQACFASIRKATKENEQKKLKLKDQLIGYKVHDGQLWPWMERYITPSHTNRSNPIATTA